MSSEVRGTPLYMAPEQLSQAPVTPATDIWAVGLIAFFLLTGRCYWKSGQNSNAVLPAVLKEVGDGPTVSPQSRCREFGIDISLPPTFDAWFLRCVNLDPLLRFQTAGDAIRALELALGMTQPLSPAAASPLSQEKRRGRRAWLMSLGLFMALGLAAMFVKSRVPSVPSAPVSTLPLNSHLTKAAVDGVTQPIRDAQVAPAPANSATLSTLTNRDNDDVALPRSSHSSLLPNQLRSAVAKSPAQPIVKSSSVASETSSTPIALLHRSTTTSKPVAPIPVSSATSETIMPPKIHRDPADHR